MKKSLLIFLSVTLTNAFAQIPNAGFEQVTTYTAGICNLGGVSVTTPTNYIVSPNTNGVTTIAHSGTKAAMIASFGGQATTIETMDCSTLQPFVTYTTAAIPTSMTAWVRRNTAITNDTLTITVAIYDATTNPLAAGQLMVKGAGYTSYTQVSIPIGVAGTGTPAKLLIGMSGSVASNSSWFVDDLAFVTAVDIAGYGAENFSMFYNSNANSVEVKTTQSTEEQISVCLYDVLGKKLIETPMQQLQKGNPISLSTNGFQSGIYLVQVQNKNGVVTTKRIFVQ